MSCGTAVPGECIFANLSNMSFSDSLACQITSLTSAQVMQRTQQRACCVSGKKVALPKSGNMNVRKKNVQRDATTDFLRKLPTRPAGCMTVAPERSSPHFLRFAGAAATVVRSYSRDRFEASTAQFTHHVSPVTALAESKRAVFSADAASVIACWNPKTAALLWSTPAAHNGGGIRTLFCVVGRVLVSVATPSPSHGQQKRAKASAGLAVRCADSGVVLPSPLPRGRDRFIACQRELPETLRREVRGQVVAAEYVAPKDTKHRLRRYDGSGSQPSPAHVHEGHGLLFVAYESGYAEAWDVSPLGVHAWRQLWGFMLGATSGGDVCAHRIAHRAGEKGAAGGGGDLEAKASDPDSISDAAGSQGEQLAAADHPGRADVGTIDMAALAGCSLTLLHGLLLFACQHDTQDKVSSYVAVGSGEQGAG